MDPLYFGEPGRPLFGLHFEPRGVPRKTAILLCPPWGMEYMRSYRALSLLADSLSLAGFETMRFDYSATGDSAGYSGEGRAVRWVADIGTAAAELRQLSGASKLCLLGLRLGGLLTVSAVRNGLDADQLVLWDTPASGSTWIHEMKTLDRISQFRKNMVRAARNQLQFDPDELLGMPFPVALGEEVEALNLKELPSKAELVVLGSADEVPVPLAGAEPIALPDAAYWSDPNWITTPWIPAASMKAICQQLSRRLP